MSIRRLFIHYIYTRIIKHIQSPHSLAHSSTPREGAQQQEQHLQQQQQPAALTNIHFILGVYTGNANATYTTGLVMCDCRWGRHSTLDLHRRRGDHYEGKRRLSATPISLADQANKATITNDSTEREGPKHREPNALVRCCCWYCCCCGSA